MYQQAGAYLNGHYLLASGRHSPKFLQTTTVMQHPENATRIGEAIAALYPELSVDFVIGPAMGGVVLAHVVAKALGCRAIFAEKTKDGSMSIREAFEIKPGERFLAVEDVITTGGSLKKAIRAAEQAGAICAGIGCVIDRGMADFASTPMRAITKLEFPTYDANDCPLCRDGVPLEEV